MIMKIIHVTKAKKFAIAHGRTCTRPLELRSKK